ncbi:transglycosylase family protein [Streptomyces sp. PR69]|uniref:transglycosylase family protein n=1 Tax=Streptomyces sp. PR69 TaxID=2984950 RepID=UPI002B27AF86|nr:transglycosylase family protein [Streptomyces sp. PR69]
MTGSAIAIPLLGAGSASAADAAAWDRVAECETGGMWSADLGNGYYGGLQISQQTWEDFGGTVYAPRPDLASRAQQIAVAEQILKVQGADAWANCAATAGLRSGGESADVDPGVEPGAVSDAVPGSGADSSGVGSAGTGSAGEGGVDEGSAGTGTTAAPSPDSPSSPSPSSSPSSVPEGVEQPTTRSGAGFSEAPQESGLRGGASASPESSGGSGGSDAQALPEDAVEPTRTIEPTDPVGPVDSDLTVGEGTGRHRGTPADESDKSGIMEDSRESGRHASRGDSSSRDASGTAVDGQGYTVRPGDSLWSIADEREVHGGWPALYEANQETVGEDPDLIHPGQSLDLGLK